jgi:type II secretory pathway pseudopilin PulG
MFSKKGQAIAELAIFGTIILMVMGVLLSYIQNQNDQQYAQMEAIRRAQQMACTHQGAESEGAGASIQFTLIQNRRQADLSGNYKMGNPQSISASSNVFWAVPKVGAQPETLLVFRVNEDQREINYRDYVPKEQDEELSLRTEDITTESNTIFNEAVVKQEDPAMIRNVWNSDLQDTITTEIPYTIRGRDGDDDEDNDPVVEEGILWNTAQGVYRDADGQYKYREGAVGTTVERTMTWTTPF